MKILLFKLGAIWDVIETTPLIRQLKQNFPNSKIDYLVWERSKAILIWNKYLNNILTFDERTFANRNIFQWLNLIYRLRKLSKNYDYIVVLDKHWILNLTAFLGWIKNRFWFNRMWKEGKFLTKSIYIDWTKRRVEEYLDILKLFWKQPNYKQQYTEVFWDIFIKLKEQENLSKKEIDLLNKYVAKKSEIDNFINNLKQYWKIIWISTWWWNPLTPSKDCRWWDIKKWEELTKTLLKKWYNILLIWSKTDRQLKINHKNFYNLLWKYSLLESIYLISKLDLIICQDSGIMHFAGAVQTPIIALFGPTNPYKIFPYDREGNFTKIWRIWKEKKECYNVYGSYDKCKGDEINKIEVREVLELIYTNLK